MANLKFSPDLFLEVAELNRFRQFVDDSGFRKNILDNTVSFGLIKSSKDFIFSNGRVERDLDTQLGQRTIKVRELNAIDKYGNFLHLDPQNGIAVPNDNNWYWVKVAYAVSHLERGTFSISGNGDLIDTSGTAELTKILRGMPNFPVRIKFTNSIYNTLEYDVLEVIDDQHATLQHPASNLNGISEFEPEDNLTIAIVGTFTQGIAVANGNKYPFNYDSAKVSLVVESFTNTAPSFLKDEEFYLARVKATTSTVIIQDKRTAYWETKGSGLALEIDRKDNPCIGIESIQYNNPFSSSDRNIVKIGWGVRSNNWSIDSSNNIVTFNSGLGGNYKTVNDFKDGDLVGGRLYAPNGKYGKITGSQKQGSAINFTLDVLDVDNFSTDGGTTLKSGYLNAVPDCDSVEVAFFPDPADNIPANVESFTFPANELVGRCDVLVYKDPKCSYNVAYRYKSGKEYSAFKPIPDSTKGYYTEASFDESGNLLPAPVSKPYTSHATNGFIELQLAPNSIRNFRMKAYKGDLTGVENITAFPTSGIQLTVGTAKNYQYVNGNISLDKDIFFALDKASAIEGNEFRIHFQCASLNLNGFGIQIVQDYGGSTQSTLKKIVQADIYQMLNQEGGICFTLKFKNGGWICYQNYDLGQPFEMKMIDVNAATLPTFFDPTSKQGVTRGYFGWELHSILNSGKVPVGYGSIIESYTTGDQAHVFNIGDQGGSVKHQQTTGEMAKHSHGLYGSEDSIGDGGYPDLGDDGNRTTAKNAGRYNAAGGAIEEAGNGDPMSLMQPYYVTVFIRRKY